MSQGFGIKEVAYVDCSSGGQVIVQCNLIYIGKMSNPDGSTIVDLSDPRNPAKPEVVKKMFNATVRTLQQPKVKSRVLARSNRSRCGEVPGKLSRFPRLGQQIRITEMAPT